jgi:hypothetical protein
MSRVVMEKHRGKQNSAMLGDAICYVCYIHIYIYVYSDIKTNSPVSSGEWGHILLHILL